MANQRSMGEEKTGVGSQKPAVGSPGTDVPAREALSMGDTATMRAGPQRRRFRAGDVILGRYRIVSELGQGGMGVVYRCFDQTGGIEVALKALPPELSHNSVEMEEVRENFRLVESLHHPNIAAAKQLERDEATGDYYLVMECAEGVNLRQWRKAEGGGLSLAKVLPVLRQVASALDFAHSRRIIHRDIKPSNVMLSADGTVKVLDFGLAAQIHTSMSRVSMVHYGTSGTGPYMAPEQWRGQRQDARADQYALGVSAYELLAGELPFENSDPAVLRQAVLQEPPGVISVLDRKAWQALERALTKEPERRFASCGDFVLALGGGRIAAAPDPHTRRGLAFVFTGAAVLSVLAYMGYGFCRTKQKKAEEAAKTLESFSRFIAATNAAEKAFLSGGWSTGTSRLERVRELGTKEAAWAERISERWQACGLSNEAARVRGRVLTLSREQSFGKRLDGLQAAWNKADAARFAGDWRLAMDGYVEVKRLAADIETLDKARQAALAAQAESEAAKNKAKAANAETWVKEIWQDAKSQDDQAKQAFESGLFEDAKKGWAGLSAHWETVQAQAQKVAACDLAGQEYAAALNAVTVPPGIRAAGKTGPVTREEVQAYLDQFGGSSWKQALQYEQDGKKAAQDPAAGAAAYKRALEALKTACLAALGGAENTRKEQQVALALDEEKRKPRLRIVVQAEEREVAGAVVALDGQDDRRVAPVTVDLEKGREHQMAVSREPDGNLTYMTTNFSVRAVWEGERTNIVALAVRHPPTPQKPVEPAKPVTSPPPAVVEADTHQYFSGRAVGGQPMLDASQFEPVQQRFRKIASDRVADALLSKTWILYNPKEIMTFENARQQAVAMGGRLPTMKELTTLLVLKREKGDWTRVNGGFFPEHLRTFQFWTEENRLLSSRQIANGLMTFGALCWVVDFSDGTASKKSADDQYGVLVIKNE